jgi:hypothetical protein
MRPHPNPVVMTDLKYAVDSPHTRGWAERIGRIIMNFSAVEMESVHWLVQLTERHEDASRFFARTFNARTVEIERCIQVRGMDKVWRRKALRAWNDARELGGIRNHVAHNPLAYWWKNPVERGEPDFVYVASMRGAGRKPREMLERGKVDKAGDEIAALTQRLAALREEWCAQRDRGLVPPAAEPKELWLRLRARVHRWIDRASLSISAIRASRGR